MAPERTKQRVAELEEAVRDLVTDCGDRGCECCRSSAALRARHRLLLADSAEQRTPEASPPWPFKTPWVEKCAKHGTYPEPDEPCWPCENKANEAVDQRPTQATRDLSPEEGRALFHMSDEEYAKQRTTNPGPRPQRPSPSASSKVWAEYLVREVHETDLTRITNLVAYLRKEAAHLEPPPSDPRLDKAAPPEDGLVARITAHVQRRSNSGWADTAAALLVEAAMQLMLRPHLDKPRSEWGCEAREKLAKARGALSDIADLFHETSGSDKEDLETAVGIAKDALEATAQPTPCTDYPRLPQHIDLSELSRVLERAGLVSDGGSVGASIDAHTLGCLTDLVRALAQRSETASPDASMNTKERGS